MSHYLRFEIDSHCRSINSCQPFIQALERQSLAPFSLDDVDLHRPLLVFCLNSQFESLSKRFEHYQEVWFLCFEEKVDSEIVASDEKKFIFSKKDLSEFESILVELTGVFQKYWIAKIRERIKKDFKKNNEDSQKAIEHFFGEQKFNFSSSIFVEDLTLKFNELQAILVQLRQIQRFDSLKDAVESIKLDDLEILLTRLAQDELTHSDFNLSAFDHFVFLPLEGNGGYDAIFIKSKVKVDLWQSLKISLIYQTISRFEYVLARRCYELDDNSLWELAVNEIEQPFALLSIGGDILVHNPAFAKMKISPKACLHFQDGQKIEEQNRLYRIKRVSLVEHHLDQILIVFQSEIDSTDEKQKKLTSSELGIVSGSLAHELNNPIAGILAAITVLELEDTWSEDEIKSLQEMKESAQRCQHLIEIFLGFSKVTPSLHTFSGVKPAFTQALNLLRFRMMESALRVDLEQYEVVGSFEKTINSSVMSMIFYLVLSDVLTHYSQLRLLDHEAMSKGKIQVFFKESPQDIQINMKHRWSLSKEYVAPKLLGHLLELEGLSLELEGHSIRLIRFGLL
jgi:hypothetical protein